MLPTDTTHASNKLLMCFEIHSKLLEDCLQLGQLQLCKVLLMNDSRFPWIILVPRIADLCDFHELPHENRQDLFNEIETVSRTLEQLFDVDKLNVAALGNQVSQLHIHIIARSKSDCAWPGPVWSTGKTIPYSKEMQDKLVEQLQQSIEDLTY